LRCRHQDEGAPPARPCELTDRHAAGFTKRSSGTACGAAVLVDDVDAVVLPVRAGDAEEEREPTPEAEPALARERALEDERVPFAPKVLPRLLQNAVEIHLKLVAGCGR
jgi:hypothetical protein